VVIGGESAGATISAATALLAVSEGGPRIDFQFLAYPKVDQVGDYPSVAENVSEGFDRAMFTFYSDCYLGADVSPTNPLVSPIFASPDVLAQLPAALILTADADPIRDEAEQFAGLLAKAGVEVTCIRAVGHTHGVLDFTADSQSARRISHAAYDVVRRFCIENAS
jgi:acetyl esterase